MQRLKVKEIRQETADACTFVFDVPPYSWHYEAGQYLTITLNIDNKRLFRSYSLASSPYHDPLPAITVKRTTGGKVSNYLHDHIAIGSVLMSSPPRGNFQISYQPHRKRTHFFIAAGSGIVPLFAMLKALLHQEPHSFATLIYINRHQTSIIYRDAIQRIQKQYQPRLEVMHILTRPKLGWQGPTGRLTPTTLQQLVQGKTEAHYWLCAPQDFMDVVYSTLFLAGVPESHIHQEAFTSPPKPTDDNLGSEAEVTVHLRGHTHTVHVQKGEKLLDALLDAGIEVPFSCCSGICNTCKVKCTQGQVHMLEEQGLSPIEKQQGYILSCVGYPLTSTLTIDLDP